MSAEQMNITLGTAGHIDHGKTALIKNLTGCDTDRLKAEKDRGMSIDLGFAPCTINNLQVGIVDVPGHESFIRTMVAGAAGIDACILVVAADDGVMPQTREHLDILTLLGVAEGIVALTKTDRIKADAIEPALARVAAFLRGTFLDGAPIVPVSNVTGAGFDVFYRALGELVAKVRPRRLDGVFRMPVERAFSLEGYGTVVSGIPISGSVRTGDDVVLLPEGRTGRIRAIQVYGRDSDVGRAGQCAAINVRHWDHESIKRGGALTVPGVFEAGEWFACRLKLLSHGNAGIENAARLTFHTGTSDRGAAVYLVEGDAAGPGATCLAQVKIDGPIIAGPGDRFILRAPSPAGTIGGGTIVEGLSRRLKRTRAGVREDLAERADAVLDEARFVSYCVRCAQGPAPTAREIARRVKLPVERTSAILEALAGEGEIERVGGGRFIHAIRAAAIGRQVTDRLEALHVESPQSLGLTFDELVRALDGERAVLDVVVRDLRESETLCERNGRLSLAGHDPDLCDEVRAALEKAEGLFRDRRFNPPSREEVADVLRKAADDTITMLLERGRLVRVSEKLLFHRDAVGRAVEIVRSHFETEEKLESVKFKYLIDTTRKYAIPLLDHLDTMGITRRAGNTRYPGRSLG